MAVGIYASAHVRMALVGILRGNSLLRLDKLSEALQDLSTAHQHLKHTFGVCSFAVLTAPAPRLYQYTSHSI